MPTYEYACAECGERLEAVQKFSDDPLTECPACKGRLRKVFSPVGIVFKGSGFYRTDSRSSSAANGSKANGPPLRPTLPPRARSRPGLTRSRRARIQARPAPTPSQRRRPTQASLRPRARRSPERCGPPGRCDIVAGVTPVTDTASIGVIGGSGFYSLLDHGTEISVDTPFGAPSDPVVTGEVAGRRVAFLPRHGHDHRFPPHRIPYRANLWALRSLGVRQVLAPSAVGSLTLDYEPGTLVIPDQLVDRTRTRAQTVLRRRPCGARAVRRPVLPGRPGPGHRRRPRRAGRPSSRAPWWSLRAHGSPRGRNRSGSPRRAGPWWA